MEDEIMAHRYIYYVLNDNVITDTHYDDLEREARKFLPSTSPVQGVGSSLHSSYSSAQKTLANYLMSNP